MTDNEQNQKLRRNPSGIPPLPYDSGEDSDQGEPKSSPCLTTVVEGENVNVEACRDPPAEEKALPSTVDDVGDADADAGAAAVDDHGASERTSPQSASIPTTDAHPPRGTHDEPSIKAEETITRGAPSSSDVSSSQNDSSVLPPSEVSASEQGSSVQMPPNIIKAALREEVLDEAAPEMVPEEEQVSSEDEKKGDDKSETDLMPPPERNTNGNVYSMPRSDQETAAALARANAMPPFPEQFHMQPMPYGYAVAPVPSPYVAHRAPPGGGRRKIFLRLEEDAQPSHARRPSFFFRHRRDDSIVSTDSVAEHGVDRGSIAVSWFEGTTSAELQEHVRKSLIRKMGLKGNVKLADLRIIDETMDPPEEIVLSPYIPDGSRFLLRFSTKEKQVLDSSTNFASRYLNNQIASTAPDSPSAAPSPHQSNMTLLNLNEDQLAALDAKLKGLDVSTSNARENAVIESDLLEEDHHEDSWHPLKRVSKTGEDGSRASTDFNEEEVMSMHHEDQIEARLRQLTDLLVSERRGKRETGASYRRQEKKQVIFVMANYFVLFLSLIAIMAEIQSRAPRWLEWAERNLESVQSCATDQESLFKCVSNGDFSGLIASFILWFGRSAATRRFFLFGFETPKRLWTVVYEAVVTAFCWGISYMFIRRGMNPDTHQNFLSKYWKDAVYGSLAGFNASFLKAVLKNLIPQEALEDALQERQIKILSWLPSFH